MRLRYWFLLILFFIGLVLFALGLYYIYEGGAPKLGFELSMIGAVAWGVLLAIGMLYVVRVRIKILRDASRF
jgi:hypothetical protein